MRPFAERTPPWLFGAWLAVAGCDHATASPPPPPKPPMAATDVPPVVARLVQRENDVRWRQASSEAWRSVETGQPLHPDDAVQTMEASRAVVYFVEGDSRLKLDPHTTLHIPHQAPQVTRLEHVSGRLVARLDHENHGQRMEVHIPPGTLVLEASGSEGGHEGGVEARLDVEAEGTRIAMVEGTGRLARRQGEPLELAENQFVRLEDDGKLMETGRMGPPVEPSVPEDDASLLTRGAVHFEWEPLAEATGGYRLRLDADGDEPRMIDVAPERTSIDVALPSGRYTWTIRGVRDGAGLPAGPPRSFQLRVDRSPPALVLQSPAAGEVVTASKVRIAGHTEPGATLDVDGHPVPVARDGTFLVRHPVRSGLTNVVVQSRDRAGNQRVVSRTVVRE